MRPALSVLFAASALCIVAQTSLSQTGNECTTVVLHAVPMVFPTCEPILDCSAAQPTTRIDNPVGPYTVYVALKNYNQVRGLVIAFFWPVPQFWSFGFGRWECQPGQLSGPTPVAPGPTTGMLATAFNPISGGALALVGYMVFNTFGPSGCLSIVRSSHPQGNFVIGPGNQELTPLLDVNEGSVCVGEEGWNTCNCNVTSVPDEGPGVRPLTWGKIKATYGY